MSREIEDTMPRSITMWTMEEGKEVIEKYGHYDDGGDPEDIDKGSSIIKKIFSGEVIKLEIEDAYSGDNDTFTIMTKEGNDFLLDKITHMQTCNEKSREVAREREEYKTPAMISSTNIILYEEERLQILRGLNMIQEKVIALQDDDPLEDIDRIVKAMKNLADRFESHKELQKPKK